VRTGFRTPQRAKRSSFSSANLFSIADARTKGEHLRPSTIENPEEMKSSVIAVMATASFAICAAAMARPSTDHPQAGLQRTVDQAIRPLMAKYRIPGMAVGLVVNGKSYVFDYGVASTATGKPVTRDTLFELGSVSKTLTATLASEAQVRGALSLSDPTGKYLPSLRGSKFGSVTLLQLGTHTPGGLPLQVPDDIRNDDQLMQYFKAWQPRYAPGTYRTYSNPGIGALGLITAKRMGRDFVTLMEGQLLPALGMQRSYIHVPAASSGNYAEGYTKDGAPIRMAPGVLPSEAYGIKTTATDMTRFVAANMNLVKLDGRLQRAIAETHTGYFKAGAITQDLIWEQYPYPVALKTLLDGNSQAMAFDATPATAIEPPLAPREDVWINKTGSTNGFGTYVAFVPQKRLGIVMLANKNYPIDARVSTAYRILGALADGEAQADARAGGPPAAGVNP
jgi:beta-lactamase class C